MAAQTIEAVISGKVQGVSFRAWTRDMARRLGLRGWVRNEDDGTVRALICGDADAVVALQQELWRGPPTSRVEQVTVNAAADADCEGFDIRY